MSEDITKICEPETSESSGQSRTASRQVFTYRALWICACFLLIQVGTETAISGWVVTYMLRVRQSSQRMANLCSSAFWTGMAISRIVLGFVSDRFGVRKTTLIYISCALISQTLFVAVQDQILSATLIALVGFFCGPLFPSAIIRLTQLLPSGLGVQAVSFVASIGQLGGALLPFGLGALSHMIGLGVFGVVIIAQFVVCLALWMAFS
jgi:fucose permease